MMSGRERMWAIIAIWIAASIGPIGVALLVDSQAAAFVGFIAFLCALIATLVLVTHHKQTARDHSRNEWRYTWKTKTTTTEHKNEGE